jgi:pimeloyl-ACP methyl ester carboxylesterase
MLKKSFSKILQYFYIPPRLFVRYDNKEGRPVLFLHGIATDGRCWDDCISNLQDQDFRIIVVDLLGFGNSPKPANSSYNLKNHAKSIEKTVKKLKIREPLTVVGHSMGSLIAVELAKRQKINLNSVILSSPPIYLPADIKDAEVQYSKTARSKNNAYFRLYKMIVNNPKTTLRAAKLATAGFSGFKLNSQTWVPFKSSLVNTIVDQTTLQDMQKINLPIQIIYGVFDLLVMPKNYQRLSKEMTNLKITKVRAGHILNSHYSKFIAKELRASLANKS